MEGTQLKRSREKKEVVFYTHYEEVLARIKPFGSYQIFCCIVILYASIEWAGNSTFMETLGSVEPDWNCTLKGGAGYVVVDNEDVDKCQKIKDQCEEINAIKDNLDFYSLRAEFKMICDNDNVHVVQIIMAAGSLVGALVGGHLGDAFGRQTLFFVGQLLIIITSMMVTASQDWLAFSIIMGVNCILYGLLETTSLTMMMEYTSNRYRIIHAACFQWPIAYMVMALIAFLTKDWQTYFVFLNLVASPLAIGFMLFHESPRWLIARHKLDEACTVLNDLAHERWNDTKAKFTTRDISTINKTHTSPPYYTLFALFKTPRLAKQTLMQLLAAFTYSIVSSTYIYTTSGIHDNAIMYTFLDGAFRIFTPLIIIFLDYRFKAFGRKMQFMGALTIEAILFAVVIILIAVGYTHNDTVVVILIIVTTMINDCVFWINIIQITTQRYPTVIRCIAFGFIQCVKHIGSIAAILGLQPLLKSDFYIGAFVIPEALILITLVLGFFFQPETKGKALMDQMVEANYGRLENAIPKALIKLAAGHKVMQMERREELRKEFEAVEAAVEKGKVVDSPWMFRGETSASRRSSTIMVHPEDVYHVEIAKTLHTIPEKLIGPKKEVKHALKEYENRAFNAEDDTEMYAEGFKIEKARKFHEKEIQLELAARMAGQSRSERRISDDEESDLSEVDIKM